MSQLKQEILKFFSTLGKEHQLFRFLYNMNVEEFRPGKDSVYYSGPYWDTEEMAALFEAVLTGKWITSGEHVYQFEKGFSEKFNQKYSVMVNSGSSANLVMISALKKYFGWIDDDEIILSTVGFPTTLSPLIQNNLKPILVDITMDDLNFDLDAVEHSITPRTRAIFISPVLGNPPDMDRLLAMAQKHQICLILDDCDSLGSRWDGKLLSDYAVASSCSFYPAHHICTGEGGMVSSNVREIVDLARSFAWWGRDCYCVGSANLLTNGTCKHRFDRWLLGYNGAIDHKYLFTNIGYNLKPLDLQGAIGQVQLKKFDEIHSKRRSNKQRIQSMFEDAIDGIRVINEYPKAETSWFGVPIYCESADIKQKLVAHLERNKVQTRNYFAGNILMHPAFQHLGNPNIYPNANQVLDKVFFVGCTPTYNDAMIQYIGETLKKFDPAEHYSPPHAKCESCTSDK